LPASPHHAVEAAVRQLRQLPVAVVPLRGVGQAEAVDHLHLPVQPEPVGDTAVHACPPARATGAREAVKGSVGGREQRALGVVAELVVRREVVQHGRGAIE